MSCFDFHRDTAYIPHPCSNLTNGTCVITSSYFVHPALWTNKQTKTDSWLSLVPLFLKITCPVLRLAHLHSCHPAKLITYVLSYFGSLPGSLVISTPLPGWLTTLDYCLLSSALALGPWILTSRCDSTYVLNVTIYREPIRTKSFRRTGEESQALLGYSSACRA